MKHLAELYLFIHPMPRKESTRNTYMQRWAKVIADEGSKDDRAICLLSNAPKEMADLIHLAEKSFGERCIVDPDDNSVQTQVLLAQDLERTINRRGNKGEWHPYEIWTSNNARRWTEGLKNRLSHLGFTVDPERLKVVTCGQQWGGCLSKYSPFMAKYLGLTAAPNLRAELSPDAGFPFSAIFKERIEMARHVFLFLFQLADGRPMGQYFDGLRAVWEPPHIAEVKTDPNAIEIVNTSPNAYLQVNGAAKVTDTCVIADVGDGCHPAITTLIGKKLGYDAFRASLMSATILPRNERIAVQYTITYLDPMTTSRGDE